MKRKIISMLLASLMIASLAACSGGNASSGEASQAGSAAGNAAASSAAQQSGEKVTIELWTDDRHDLTYVNSQIDKFNSTNTQNIQVKLTTVTDNYVNMLSMAKSSGTAPDIAGMSGGEDLDMKLFADSQLVLPLNDYIKAAGDDFEKATDCSKHVFEGMNAVDGKIYWVPTAVRSGTRMIYNADLVKAAGVSKLPTTISELVTLAKKITQNGNGKYYGFATTSSAPFVRCFEGMAEKSGQNRYGYDYVNGKYDFSGYKPLINEFKKIFTDKSVLPGSSTQGVDAMRAQFANGVVGIWANASQEAGVFTDQFPVTKFKWEVGEIPTLDGTVKGALTAMPQKGYMIMSTSKHPEQAWEVIRFFSSEDFIKGYCEQGYALPYSDEVKSVVDTAKSGRINDFSLKDYESVYPVAPAVTIDGEDMQTVLWSAIMGQRDVDTAISDLNTRYNKALENDVAAGKVKRLVIQDFDPMHPSQGTIQYLSK